MTGRGRKAVGDAGRARCPRRVTYVGAGPRRQGPRYVGLDVPQASIAVAVAVVEADGVERPLGLIPNRPDAPRGRRALVPRLTALRQGLAAFLHEYDQRPRPQRLSHLGPRPRRGLGSRQDVAIKTRAMSAARRYSSGRGHARWWREAESNRRHMDFQSTALPTELSRRSAATAVSGPVWGGRCRARTCDLYGVNVALSQLS